MGGVFKIIGSDGKLPCSDGPVGASGAPANTPAGKHCDLADEGTRLARKHLPDPVPYLEPLDSLRHHRPMRFDGLVRELQKLDPKLGRYRSDEAPEAADACLRSDR
jgi:hypothetical protein